MAEYFLDKPHKPAYLFMRYYIDRARYYLYPIKIWFFVLEQQDLFFGWDELSTPQRLNILENIDYIAGFRLTGIDFPGYEEIYSLNEISILKRQ